MANQPPTIDPVTGLPEITVQATLGDLNYNINAFKNQNFLKSAKFAVRFGSFPSFLNIRGNDVRKFTYLCDSVEFPGQSLTATDYRIPGKLKVKIPYLRDMNEISLTFYFPTDLQLYNIFSEWIYNISPTNSTNRYFDEIVSQISIYQFQDTTTSILFGNKMIQHMQISLIDAYPLNFQSMPSNWADDGFHKITASFFYRDLTIKTFK